MPRSIFRTLLLPGIFLLAFSSPRAADKSATILVWSDLHGSVPDELKFLVDSLREEAAAHGHPFLALDVGDALLGSRIAELTRGISQTAQLNLLRPDAMTLGMGDFAWNRPRLDSLLGALSVPVVTTNLRRNLDDNAIGGYKSLLVPAESLKVGILGISDPDLDYPERQETIGDMRVDPEAAAASWASAELRGEGAALVIALCHADLAVAQKVARTEGIDLVVAAHDAKSSSLTRTENTWVAHLAPGAENVLRIDLAAAETGWTANATAIGLPKGKPSNAAWKFLKAVHDSVLRVRLNTEVGVLKSAWPATRREGMLGNWLADALRGGTGSDLALVPAGWIQKGLPKGRVRLGDVWDAIPPGLNMVSVFSLPGSDIVSFLERQMRNSKDFLFVSGLTTTADSSMFGGNYLRATVGGKPIDKSAYYTIAIPKLLRDDIRELTGFSLSSAGPEWTGKWECDLVQQWALDHGLSTETGRVPSMYGGNAPR